jgi:hypothetical protein
MNHHAQIKERNGRKRAQIATANPNNKFDTNARM